MSLFDRIAYNPVPYALRIVLVIFLGLLLLGVCMDAQAKPPSVVFHSENVTVTLVQDACLNPAVLAQIVPQSQSLFLSGRVVWQGQDIGMCWTLLNDGNVFIVDETGDSGVIPANLFKRLTGV